MLDPGQPGQTFECGLGDAEKPGRAALDRLIGKLESAAGLADPAQGRGGPQTRSQRHCIAGRTHLRVRGIGQAVAQPRRARRGHRARDRSCGASRRHPLFAPGRGPVVSVRHAAGRFHRRRLGGDCGKDGGAIGLFARRGKRSRFVQRQPDGEGRRRSAGAGHDPRPHRGHESSRARKSCSTIRRPRIASPRSMLRRTALPSKIAPLLSAADWAALKRICG